MNVSEITELAYRRGMRSAKSEPVDVDFDLLDTERWRLFLRGRGLAATGFSDQLFRIGLAKKVGGELRPLRADVRVFHYKGTAIEACEGVHMMFTLMRANSLYPPQYRELREQAQEAVMVTLLNEERPPSLGTGERLDGSQWTNQQRRALCHCRARHVKGVQTTKAMGGARFAGAGFDQSQTKYGLSETCDGEQHRT